VYHFKQFEYSMNIKAINLFSYIFSFIGKLTTFFKKKTKPKTASILFIILI